MGTPRKKELKGFIVCRSCGYKNPATATACHNCAALLHFDGHKTSITVSGIDAEEVQKVSLALLEKTKSSGSSPSPWISGSFYLVVFIVVIVALSVAGHILPTIVLPVVLIGACLPFLSLEHYRCAKMKS